MSSVWVGLRERERKHTTAVEPVELATGATLLDTLEEAEDFAAPTAFEEVAAVAERTTLEDDAAEVARTLLETARLLWFPPFP